MNSELSFRLVPFGSPEYDQTVALRYEILRRPLGLSFDPAQLSAEGTDHHLACYRDDELVGCLVLTPRAAGEMKMRQVAVAESLQGTGIGRRMVEESERITRELGFDRISLNARANVVPFYEKLGYQVFGQPFEEVTIRHRSMWKVL
ncbi:MAG TPA: GNAT family N-acetyltransferase [Candidatus Kapabacteria bacterium]|nr:GNAT family N-acetyltransferase [Candidatus Kapabacteria bacterium]